MCHPASIPVFAPVVSEDHVVAWIPPWVEWPGWWRALVAFGKICRRLRRLAPEIAVCSWADARVEWLMRWSGAPRRIGFPMTRMNYYASRVPWRTRYLRWGRLLSLAGSILSGGRLLTGRLSRRSEHQLHLEDWRQVADALGFDCDVSVPWLAAPSGCESPVESILARFRLR